MFLSILNLLLVCLVSCTFGQSTKTFNPKDYDYCKVTCKNNPYAEHTACGCSIHPDVTEVFLDIMPKYRQQILNDHNKFRESVATGEALNQNPAIVAAANMRVLNYDLELEHIARCLARQFRAKYKCYHDKCRYRFNGLHVGQNLAGYSNDDKNEWFKLAMNATTQWFIEIELKDMMTADLVDKFKLDHHEIGHFTEMVWAELKYVGCFTAWDKNNHFKPGYSLVTVCNYAGDKSGGNVLEQQMYLKGEACSKCPPEDPCDKTGPFPHLCGKLLPVPKDPPPVLAGCAQLGFHVFLMLGFGLFLSTCH